MKSAREVAIAKFKRLERHAVGTTNGAALDVDETYDELERIIRDVQRDALLHAAKTAYAAILGGDMAEPTELGRQLAPIVYRLLKQEAEKVGRG